MLELDLEKPPSKFATPPVVKKEPQHHVLHLKSETSVPATAPDDPAATRFSLLELH